MSRMKFWIALGLLALTMFTQNVEKVQAKEKEDKLALSVRHLKAEDEEIIDKNDINKIVSKIPTLTNELSIESLIEIEERMNMSNEEIAKLVYEGHYGNGQKRRELLEEEGRDFDEIQKEVEKLKSKVTSEAVTKTSKDNSSQNKSEPIKAASGGKTLVMEATAYSTSEPELGRYTANGTDLHVNPRVIAVDPNVIPLGTKVTIEGYGTYIAADTGGAIKGNRIDIHFQTVEECISFGRKNVNVTIHN